MEVYYKMEIPGRSSVTVECKKVQEFLRQNVSQTLLL
jgi:hypothetical protein